MKKIFQRLLMFAVGVPLVIGIIVFLPHNNHLVANGIVTILSALGAIEFAQMLGKKSYRLAYWEAGILGALPPLAMTLSVCFGITSELLPAVIIAGASWVTASRVFSSRKELADTGNRIAVAFATLIYPGLFMSWIIRMTAFEHPIPILISFLLIIFSNDSLAWAVGMLFGKGNRGIFPASPNKSIVGFIGGICGSIIVGILASIIVPKAFVSVLFPAPVSGAIIGLFTGMMAIIGDLAESTIKRSADVKDSGSIIPGRGGILDSIDSMALAAPVFYVLYWLLF